MKEIFLKRMEMLLGKEYPAYLATLDEAYYRGLRINTLKTDINSFKSEFPYLLEATSFCPESFYIDQNIESLGNHPYHTCGLFYLQEPSASSAVEILDVEKGDWVLDLCAAPGGKSTQIAAKLNHTGFLVSNEIERSRANILLSNLERIGAGENMITNANPKQLCEALKGHFDKVLVDAPCSGEGMFKKNTHAIDEWSEEHVAACKIRQLFILNSAYDALKQDGIMVYSTCTYATEENEQVIYEFLQQHPDMELIDCGVEFGREGIAYKDLLKYVRRIFPMDKGEGHFIAKMKRNSENTPVKLTYTKPYKVPPFVSAFFKDQLVKVPSYVKLQDQYVYIKKMPFIELKNIRVLRQGILCGEVRKERMEPHHHFYVSAYLKPFFHHVTELNEEEVHIFYSGNVVPIAHIKGYTALSYHGHVLGFGKGDQKVVKNKLPKGLRCTLPKDLF